jgi:DNA polymerase-3 subunit delta
MAALKGREIEEFLARGFRETPIILFYGPDQGMVHERASMVAQKLLEGSSDPFAHVKLDGDDLAADPLRLADEANSIGMFGGRRVIQVRAGGRAITAALAPLLSSPPVDASVVIEAGDLKGSAPLRTQIEQARRAAAIPCYPEEGRDLARLIDSVLAADGLSAEGPARDMLLASLGQDRMRSRSELDKLALYARGQGRISVADVEAVVTDAAPVTSDTAIDAAFLGNTAAISQEAARAFADGEVPAVLLGAALRHALLLRQIAAEVAGGQTTGEAVRRARLHFRRQAAVERQAPLWNVERLDRCIGLIADAVLGTRRTPRLAEALAVRALWSISLAAKRGPGGQRR